MIRGVTGEDGAGLTNAIQFREHVLLNFQVLKDRFDDHVDMSEVTKVRRGCHVCHNRVGLVCCKPAPFDTNGIVLSNFFQAQTNGFVCHIDESDFDPCLCKTHRNATAHGASANNTHAGNI